MHFNRRILLRSLAASVAATALRPAASFSQASPLTKPIPSSGEALPLVGLGSWTTFNVGDDSMARDNCAEVMRAFFAQGGRMIDSSPMYGSAQEVIGSALKKLGETVTCFPRIRFGPRQAPTALLRSKSRASTGACRASTFCKFITCWRGKRILRRFSP